MFNFSLDFRKLVSDLLPPDLRKAKRIDWLLVLVSQIKSIHTQFVALATQKRFDLQFTSQVIYLEYLLNYRFNGGLNTIYIADAQNPDYVYLWQRAENVKLYIYNRVENESKTFVYNRAEFNHYADFVVMVPALLVFNRSEMVALINRYKIAGKIFTIKTY
jgi:hypothetical protein